MFDELRRKRGRISVGAGIVGKGMPTGMGGIE
jgi:hypothetical protein